MRQRSRTTGIDQGRGAHRTQNPILVLVLVLVPAVVAVSGDIGPGHHRAYGQERESGYWPVRMIRADREDVAEVVNDVTLELHVSTMSRSGYAIEIRPGHAACRFDPVTLNVPAGDSRQTLRLATMVVRSVAADRDCSFEFMIREPGQPVKSTFRGFRLTKPDRPDAPPRRHALSYYLSAPSLTTSLERNSAPTGPTKVARQPIGEERLESGATSRSGVRSSSSTSPSSSSSGRSRPIRTSDAKGIPKITRPVIETPPAGELEPATPPTTPAPAPNTPSADPTAGLPQLPVEPQLTPPGASANPGN